MNSIKTKYLTRTAILLSLTLVFQLTGKFLTPYIGPNGQFIVGPLVNACLIIATASVGLWSGAFISVIAPLVSFATTSSPPLPFVPFVAAGNFLLVFCFYIIKKNHYMGILTGAIVKSGFLFTSIVWFLKFFKDMLNIPPKAATAMTLAFGWPQLITALLGGTIALAVIKAIGKNIEL